MTVAIAVAGNVEFDDGEGRMIALGCSAETVIFPSLPENIPFLSVFVFDRTKSVLPVRMFMGGNSA